MLILCFSPFHYTWFSSGAIFSTQVSQEKTKVVKSEGCGHLPGLLDKGIMTIGEEHRRVEKPLTRTVFFKDLRTAWTINQTRKRSPYIIRK